MSGLDLTTSAKLRQTWQQLSDRFEQRSKREKYILLAASVMVSVMLWQSLLVDPLLLDRAKRKQIADQLSNEKNTMNNELTIIDAQLQVDPHVEKRRRLQKLQETINATQKQLQSTTQALIPPQHMPQAIEELFARFEGLKLLNMTNLPATPLMVRKTDRVENGSIKPSQKSEQENLAAATGLYRHAVEIVFVGDFRHTLEFLKAMENLSWRFLWDSLQYEVQAYPDATIKLQIYTFSTSKEWIGV